MTFPLSKSKSMLLLLYLTCTWLRSYCRLAASPWFCLSYQVIRDFSSCKDVISSKCCSLYSFWSSIKVCCTTTTSINASSSFCSYLAKDNIGFISWMFLKIFLLPIRIKLILILILVFLITQRHLLVLSKLFLFLLLFIMGIIFLLLSQLSLLTSSSWLFSFLGTSSFVAFSPLTFWTLEIASQNLLVVSPFEDLA